MNERITTVAIWKRGSVYSLPRPNRHCNLIWWMESIEVDPKGGHQGFMTDTGRFVDRKEAATIALAAGQIPEPKAQLYSEDLWDGNGECHPDWFPSPSHADAAVMGGE